MRFLSPAGLPDFGPPGHRHGVCKRRQALHLPESFNPVPYCRCVACQILFHMFTGVLQYAGYKSLRLLGQPLVHEVASQAAMLSVAAPLHPKNYLYVDAMNTHGALPALLQAAQCFLQLIAAVLLRHPAEDHSLKITCVRVPETGQLGMCAGSRRQRSAPLRQRAPGASPAHSRRQRLRQKRSCISAGIRR